MKRKDELLPNNGREKLTRQLPRNSEKREGGKFSGPAEAFRVEALNFLEFLFLFVQAKRKEESDFILLSLEN